MKRSQEYIVEIGYWIALIFLLGGSAILFAILVGAIGFDYLAQISMKLWGAVLTYALASFFLLLGLYFMGLILRTHRRRSRFAKEGPRGQIQVSPFAIKEFIAEILKREIGLSRFRIGLDHVDDGVKIRVSVSLAMSHNVVEVGKRVQELLKERVEERIGVKVNEVELFTESIGQATPSKPPESSKATNSTEDDSNEQN